MEYLVLTELTLFRLLWRAALRRPTCVVHTLSLLKGSSTAYLDSIERWLKANHRIVEVTEFHSDLRHYKDYGDFLRLTDAFGENLDWLENYGDFENATKRFGEFDIAYKHVSSAVAYRHFVVNYILQKAIENGPDIDDRSKTTVSGLDSFDLSFYRHRFRENPPGKIIPRLKIDPLLNVLLCLAACLKTFLFALRRTRLSLPFQKPFHIGTDFVAGNKNHFWEEVARTPEDILLVFRNKHDQQTAEKQLSGWHTCLYSGGLFSLRDFFPAVGEMVSDYFRLLRQAWAMPTDLFRGLVALPYHRTAFRALCNRYRFKYFWARDDYNPEHTMRTRELRRIGAVSMGAFHGIPSLWSYTFQNTYLDFDVYYIFGWDQYTRYYRRTWPQHMEVRTLGSSGMTRDDFKRLGEQKGNDIACFISPCFHNQSIFDAVVDIATAFPDRKIYINVKVGRYLDGAFANGLNHFLDTGPKNIFRHEGIAYDLFFKCQFVLTEGSTLAAEGIQFGCYSIAMDLSPKHKVFSYRYFPGLCVTSSKQAIDRIRALDEGREEYRRDDFAELIELNGKVPWEVIREDMGILVDQNTHAPEITSKPSV
ncbi:MAG: hypothetical protein HQ494_07005 [Rhodospirillales bacterium]|nr:hypothetical protein [Rhodospirillales bacterium]